MTADQPGADHPDGDDDTPGAGAPMMSSDPHAELLTDPDAPAKSLRPLHLRPSAMAWIFAGGIAGTALRYYAEKALPHDGASWPWGTFLINLCGAFILGGLLEALARLGDDSGWRQRARLCAGTGFCGAFTTYSTFALEITLLGRHGHLGIAVGYGLLSVVGGVLTAWTGIVLMSNVGRRRARA
jgi:CrcB protein